MAIARPPSDMMLAESPHKRMIAECRQRRERQDERHDQRGAQIAEEQHQQDDDEHDRLDQNLLHGPDGLADQFAAVVENLDLRAVRQVRLEFGQLAPSRH